MKKNKWIAVLAALLSLALLCGCGAGTGESGSAVETDPAHDDNSPNANYAVTVTDVKGNPMTDGVIVRFMQNGQQAAMQMVDASGVATKELPKGDYTVELKFTSDVTYVYDQTDLTLSAEKTALTIALANEMVGEGTALFAGGQECIAYPVEACSTQVPLTPGARSYFLFTPTEPGTYEISVDGDVESFGYYGTPFYVQDNNIGEMVDNTMVISLSQDMIGGNTLVLGVDGGSAESAVLSVIRIGEPQWTIASEPWTIYQPTAQLAPYKLPAGARVETFDLTAPTSEYNLVYNEEDGFYHLDTADGSLVLVYLGKDCQYIACFQTILTRTAVKTYFFDEDGNLLKKEDYDPCLRQYFENMDVDNGVYPLTEDLKYIIQQRGNAAGWWDLGSNTSVFYDADGNKVPGINEELAWLLMCGYIAK